MDLIAVFTVINNVKHANQFTSSTNKYTMSRFSALSFFGLYRQIRNKASRGALWQKRRSSAARVYPMTPRTTARKKQHSLSDGDFFVSCGSTVRGVFIPTLQHTFK